MPETLRNEPAAPALERPPTATPLHDRDACHSPQPARLLRDHDDVATAVRDLRAGATVDLRTAQGTFAVTLRDDISTGHKFAVRDLSCGVRVRKYGEFIGRMSRDVRTGEHVHVHNLATGAQRAADEQHAWCAQTDASGVRAIGMPRAHVGECPVYDERADCLYWIDVRDTPAIHRIGLATGVETTWPMHEDIGAIALMHDARLVAALRSGFAFFDPADGALQPICDPEPDQPRNRLNDGSCDRSGRFWCGSMNPGSGTADGSLHVLGPDLRCARVLGDFVTPNGLAWSPDGGTLYVADTRRGYIHAFDCDPLTATLSGRRLFADLGSLPGGPDGATVDCEGHLWSALWEGGCLVRFDPQGRMQRVVRLPVSKPTSCTFGGAGYRQLFVTTATRGLDAQQLRCEPLAGRVLVLDVGVAGCAPARFGGNTPRPDALDAA